MNRLSDFASTLGPRFETRRFYLSFCFACFFIALTLGLLITQSGPGVGPDSHMYIKAGENIYYGNGFHVNTYYFNQFDATGGKPYTHYPLYPLSIAAFMQLGFDGEQAARLISILCFALLAFPLFFLGKTVSGALTGYVACLICLVLTPLLWCASWAMTEMMYIFFSVLTILFLAKFAEGNEAKTKILCVSAFFTALAILTRYSGAALVPVGLIVIVLKNRTRLREEDKSQLTKKKRKARLREKRKSSLRDAVYQTVVFGSISCLPVMPWLYRNMALTSNFLGNAAGWGGDYPRGLLATVNTTVVTIWADFVADPLSQKLLSYLHLDAYILSAITVTCFILLVIYVRTHSADRKVLVKYLGKSCVLVSYILIYLIPIIIIKSNYGYAIDSRRIAPVYPFLILVGISFIFYAYSQIKKTSLKRTLFLMITILCVLSVASQASSSLAFYQSAKHGQGFNSPVLGNAQWIPWVTSNVPYNATLYSNRPYVIEFKTRRPTHYLPPSGNEKAIDEWFAKLTHQENSFVICFKRSAKASKSQPLNSEFTEMNQKYDVLVVLADFPEATIWRVRP